MRKKITPKSTPVSVALNVLNLVEAVREVAGSGAARDRTMRRMAVEHEKRRPPAVAHEGFGLGDEQLGVEFAGIDVVSEGTSGIDRRDGVNLLALAAGCTDWRLTLGAPGAL